ncbi:polycystic kidney disease protein 1-like 1 [Microcaecilia unicolor]|uniref:Polycystic kidney disease protein 1-like 1 n=1 Tax=Microcaecilia unicolor TaxID=1415580 RepID=A0A6P7YPV3_9AMPH|nr:polycystic kidney disease protein 1-like 1 [Microcaecilia unicolor]
MRFGVIALWNETNCYCINANRLSQQSVNLNASESSSKRSNSSHVNTRMHNTCRSSIPVRTGECSTRCMGPVCLLYGDGKMSLAVYSTIGPYIHNTSLSLVANRVQIGKAFMLELSGYLACPLEMILGILNVTSDSFSTVQLVIQWSSANMSNSVTEVQLNGYFSFSLDWVYAEPGDHLILLHANNMFSNEELSINVEVLLPAPDSLEVKVDSTEEKIPSCVPFEVDTAIPQEWLFLGIQYQFIAYVSMGIDLEFQWYFSDDNSTLHTSSLYSDCLTSTMNHTFTEEGLYQVCVNVSNCYNWIRQIINMNIATDSSSIILRFGNGTDKLLPVFDHRSSITFKTQISGVHHISVSVSSPLYSDIFIQHVPNQVKVCAPLADVKIYLPFRINYVALELQIDGFYSSQLQEFRVQDPEATDFLVDFGDGSPVVLATHNDQMYGAGASVYHQYKSAVSVYTNGTVFAAGTDILFMAVSAVTGPLEFVWHFGDQLPEKTTSRRITKRYMVPKRYNVIVNASNHISSFTSAIATIAVQERIVPNRLVARASVLINTTATFECRIYSGTNVTYLWSFGDGTVRLGRNTAYHIYNREGEFTVEVRCFNNVSSALLTKQIFVVRQPCQPPPVKHMGPLKLQVRRYQSLQLGVIFESAILCNISQGLLYSWSLLRSDGVQVLLHPNMDNRKQTILFPSYFLEYGNYTAIARVQIMGSVVYSNYTVPLEVSASSPVSVISGATHLFLSTSSAALISLNGSGSYDPDYPESDLRFHWKCVPASLQKKSCFHHGVSSPFSTGPPAVTFPVAVLHDTFDQFLVTLVVSTSDRNSSEAQVFLSLQSNHSVRSVNVICTGCRGDSVNWNEGFSVRAVCAECAGSPNLKYSWKLYLINATDTVDVEVPICRALDLMEPSSLFVAALSSPTTTTTLTATAGITNTEPTYPSINMSSIFKANSTLLRSTIAITSESTATPATTVGLMELPGNLEEGTSGARSPKSWSSIDLLQRRTFPDPLEHRSANESRGTVTGGGTGGGWRNDSFDSTINDTVRDFETHYSEIQEGGGASGGRPTGQTSSSSKQHIDIQSGDNLVDSSNFANIPCTSYFCWTVQRAH